ncbi:uncharacterized protein BDZ99DRAFT_474241 [Mytilinidion resinicola]|uniref:Uncharacterized protein n=1 Tax=Mytilinidion resinicola TaxID=574789 RepID=A0A6A6YYI3_9PEZI|nr:uncharacterized protein BDZ99DRAFT_474241 [Mytilinidion resinicola]KAF2813608.1 hypothetical protein BDZ99DRAFT_474241 [Mytilinidion resinicola]
MPRQPPVWMNCTPPIPFYGTQPTHYERTVIVGNVLGGQFEVKYNINRQDGEGGPARDSTNSSELGLQHYNLGSATHMPVTYQDGMLIQEEVTEIRVHINFNLSSEELVQLCLRLIENPAPRNQMLYIVVAAACHYIRRGVLQRLQLMEYAIAWMRAKLRSLEKRCFEDQKIQGDFNQLMVVFVEKLEDEVDRVGMFAPIILGEALAFVTIHGGTHHKQQFLNSYATYSGLASPIYPQCSWSQMHHAPPDRLKAAEMKMNRAAGNMEVEGKEAGEHEADEEEAEEEEGRADNHDQDEIE